MIIGNGNGWSFVHVPKCGGTWVVETVNLNGLGYTPHEKGERPGGHDWPIGNRVDPERLLTVRYEAIHFPGRLRFATVRHPVSWYNSYYQYRMGEHGFKGRVLILDRMKQDFRRVPPFPDFVHWTVRNYPGYLGRLYDQMIGDSCDFVWKTESMALGFQRAMEMAEQEVDMLPPGKVNESKPMEIMTPYLEELILEYEPAALARWEKAWHAPTS